MPVGEDQLLLFKSIFKGRQDVYAKRWEAKDKAGYAPAYDIDWSGYELHKATGGTIKDYPHKTYSTINEGVITGHLEGKEVIGVYPLLENNTSWFASVDFDENNWRDEITKLYEICMANQLQSYIERSRSGNGGHLWIFFEQPYLARKSRAIIKWLLKQVGIKTASNSSYDRIFPNQDYHTGKGLGNLIALPLQKRALENGNSAFINPTTFEPFPDQWDFLQSVRRVGIDRLEVIYSMCSDTTIKELHPALINHKGDGLQIILANTITIGRNNLLPEMVVFLRNNLKANNPTFFIRKATGQNTVGTPASTTLLEEHTDRLVVPRGYVGAVLRYCKANKIDYKFTDQRKKLPEVEFTLKGQLYDHQVPALSIVERKEMGVIVAPPGSGKTIMGLAIIAQKKQPALIIVHRIQLFDQWVQRIQSFLGIPKHGIGRIAKGQADVGESITVAMIQSLNNTEVLSKIQTSFGIIIIDECHHLAAEAYRSILQKLHTYYIYGFTATPIRKNKDEKLVFAQIGEVIHEVVVPKSSEQAALSVNVIDTDLKVPFNASTDDFERLSDILIHDTARNGMIAENIRQEINNGRDIIVLTERKDHVEILNQFLKHDCETIALTGDDSEASRKSKLNVIQEGRFQVTLIRKRDLRSGKACWTSD